MDAAPLTLDWRPESAFVQAGSSARDSHVAGIGLRWDVPWPATRWGPGWTAAVDVTLSRWSAGLSAPGAPREHAIQWTLMPTVRWRPIQGGSPWFAEAGLGVSLHDRRYHVESVEQSSRWNFQEVLALGHAWGRHEVSLRLAHMSNAGLRKPNPGETWWTVRWSGAF